MAKQKKKVKKKIPKLPKKDRKLFLIINFTVGFVFFVLFFVNFRFNNYLVFRFSPEGSIYAESKFSLFALFFGIAPFAISALAFFNYDASIDLGIPFKEYYSRKNKKANTQIKSAIIAGVCIVLIWALMIPVAPRSHLSINEGKATRYYTISHEKTLFTYNEITHIKVFIIDSAHIAPYNYEIIPYVTVTANGKEYGLSSEFFKNNIVGVEEFLNQFDKSIITVDNKYKEKISYTDKDYEEAFHRIFG
ncbi:MAG: hypothetical protein K5761_06660 [Clostridiales bacterium]|nr:hypothetical protein [Clostridiales bacterium]